MNVGKDYKDRLPTEEQTRKSLSRYFGFKHSKINTLASSDFSRITEMQSKGWLLESSKEEIGQLIEDFVNIYGYIYKNGNDSGYNRLIRGTTINETNNLREGSETYGKWYGVLLSAENKKQFFIPKGFAHGFLVLSDFAEFAYKCTDFYHPNDEGGLAYNDPEIGVEWPIPEGMELIMSEKDQKWGGLSSLKK